MYVVLHTYKRKYKMEFPFSFHLTYTITKTALTIARDSTSSHCEFIQYFVFIDIKRNRAGIEANNSSIGVGMMTRDRVGKLK